MIKPVSRIVIIALATSAFFIKGYGQTDTVNVGSYDAMSLKDLLNIKIVSASKSAESLFDAPLSASVITKEEIQKSGYTTVMEALRLVPGLIVREQSNGNYDIHLRGMDNVPPNASFDLTSNTTTLVMVDNRPIYSYLRGGTFWETLPVGLNDVEKIEVVRGPAAALYGPNAVNGVINIITKQVEKKGWYANVGNREGSYATFLNNASVGYRFNRFNIIASGNYQHRNRSQESYFEYARNQWFTNPDYLLNLGGDTMRNVNANYPRPRLAMEKYAGNVFATYQVSEKTKFSLSAGIQHSLAQRVSTENAATPLSFATSDTRYADLRGNINGLSAQFSYTDGTQSVENTPGNKYDFNIFKGSIEYNYNKKRFSIKPGISYESAVYDDRKYSDIAHRTGIFNTRGVITTLSASLRGEYRMFGNKLRLVGGLAISKFNYPDTAYASYQLAATYKLNKKNLFRAVFSGAPRSANVYDTYVDQAVLMYPAGVNTYGSIVVRGNKDMRLLTAKMIEIGYRSELSRHVSIDVELFDIRSKDYSFQLKHKPFTMIAGPDTIHVMPLMSDNLPMRLEQTGITVSMTIGTEKLKIKPFATLQHTEIKDYVASDEMPGGGAVDIYSGLGSRSTLKSTPALFGGGTIDYRLGRKVNININSYYFTKQVYYHVTNLVFNDGVRGIDHIAGKLIVNANISYQPVKGLQVFCTAKNLLNQTAHEFYYTDKVPFMLLGGFSYQLP
jgi:iron complex outermembrane receptor protein